MWMAATMAKITERSCAPVQITFFVAFLCVVLDFRVAGQIMIHAGYGVRGCLDMTYI
jgi:hypothetical protein